MTFQYRQYIFFRRSKGNFIQITQRSFWNTSSRSLGSSSTHTSVSAVKTALRAKECANELPSLNTWWKEQIYNVAPILRASSITCPYNVRLLPGACKAWITLLQSPSTITLRKLISVASYTARLAARASAISTNWGNAIFWLRAANTFPLQSLTTTPSPAIEQGSVEVGFIQVFRQWRPTNPGRSGSHHWLRFLSVKVFLHHCFCSLSNLK